MSDNDFVTLGAIVKAAQERLTPQKWDALIGAAETETTLKRNRLALDSLAFRPRVLRDMRNVDMTSTLWGAAMRIPVMLAPVGSLASLHPDGGPAVAKAAEEFGTIKILSSASLKDFKIEAVRAASKAPMIFQLYIRDSDDWAIAQFKKARDLGFMGICLTLDTAANGQRERELMYGRDRRKVDPKSEEATLAVTWDLVKKVRDSIDLPLVLKGLATAEDAEIAVQEGIEGVYISNHGGRNMDFGRGAIDVLPEVVAVAKGKAKIVVDGGICRGSDVIKAIALGADAVAIGKLQGWGMAAGGQAGVVAVLKLLEAEMKANMILLGADRLDKLNPGCVEKVTPTVEPTVVAAFPQYDIPLARY